MKIWNFCRRALTSRNFLRPKKFLVSTCLSGWIPPPSPRIAPSDRENVLNPPFQPIFVNFNFFPFYEKGMNTTIINRSSLLNWINPDMFQENLNTVSLYVLGNNIISSHWYWLINLNECKRIANIKSLD